MISSETGTLGQITKRTLGQNRLIEFQGIKQITKKRQKACGHLTFFFLPKKDNQKMSGETVSQCQFVYAHYSSCTCI